MTKPTLLPPDKSLEPEGISVCLITKNCAKALDECLTSLKNFLKPQHGDEVIIVDTGSNDCAKNSKVPATVAVAKRHGARVLRHPELTISGMADLVREFLPEHAGLSEAEQQHSDGFLADFAAARQLASDAARNDLVFWIDSDDVLVGGNRLREMAAQFFQGARDARQLFMAYDYSFSEDGACDTVLWRERICRRSMFEWRGVCHETMVPRTKGLQVTIAKVSDTDSKLVHKHTRGHTISDIRNYAILRRIHDEAAKSKEWIDPRWEFYLGNACRGLGKLKEAVRWYTKVLTRSGNREDRVACALNISYAYLFWDRPWRAIDWAMQAMKIDADDARAYFLVARCQFALKRYQDCLHWTDLGNAVGKPTDNLSAYDPATYSTQPAVFAAQALCELKRFTQARDVVADALKDRPGLKPLQDLATYIDAKLQVQTLTNAVATVSGTAFSHAAVRNVIWAVKPEIRAQIPDLQLETFVPRTERSVTFLCGPTQEPWSDASFQEGIGGSEKQEILMAREFAKAGIPVNVYCECRPEEANKTIAGVTWKPYQAFNIELPRDILIVWRAFQWLDLPLKANKIFIALHDCQDPSNYTPARLEKLSGALFKSEFHAAPVKHFFETSPEKLIISRNAIDPALFTPLDAPRNYKRILYASSPDRGLKRALKMFGRIKAAEPSATMEVAYGFGPLYFKKAAEREYQFMRDDNAERSMNDFVEEVYDLADRLGVKMHGRMGSQALADLMKTSSVLLYPCGFEEINCLCVQEAQAAGCLPVTTNKFALPEVVEYGTLLPYEDDDAFITATLGILAKGADLDTYRKEASEWAIRTKNAADLAKELMSMFWTEVAHDSTESSSSEAITATSVCK